MNYKIGDLVLCRQFDGNGIMGQENNYKDYKWAIIVDPEEIDHKQPYYERFKDFIISGRMSNAFDYLVFVPVLQQCRRIQEGCIVDSRRDELVNKVFSLLISPDGTSRKLGWAVLQENLGLYGS